MSGDSKWPLDGVLHGSDSAYYNADGTCPHLPYRDLVAEWVEPVEEPEVAVAEAPATVEVKAGDRVRRVESDVKTVCPVGFETTILAVEDGVIWYSDVRGSKTSSSAGHGVWEVIAPAAPVEPADTPAPLKIGDRVRIVRNTRGDAHLDKEIGREFTIRMADGENDDGWSGDTAENDYWWPSADLELVAVPPTPSQSFIVARLTAKGDPRPNVRPRVHTSLADAEAEAQRLADRLGDEFAIYQRVSSKTVDAGPVPVNFGSKQFDVALAKAWIENGKGECDANGARPGMAFSWSETPQGFGFWATQSDQLTHLGRAILRKWIAAAEQPAAKETA